jgi:plasmid stabilization system protein ParE
MFGIRSFLARDSEDAAHRVGREIHNACGSLAAGPLRGHSRPEPTSLELRFRTWTRYPNYTVVYRPQTMPLRIVAVLHGKRDMRRILEER